MTHCAEQLLRNTRPHTLLELRLRKAAPDEDKPALRRVIWSPTPPKAAVELRVDALKDKLFRCALDIQNALVTQYVLPIGMENTLKPFLDLGITRV